MTDHVILSTVAVADPSATLTDATDLRTHISALLDMYISRFSSSNLSAASSYYHEPATAMSASDVLFYHTREDI